ncbi:MAG: energy transducer TonB, partial [Prevotella sp.]|nr:energy transducer TonB [Prevotella sp.]
QYQMLLIRKSVGERAFLLANNLNHNSLKKRIKMMKTTKTNKWQCLKALVMLPIAACAVVAFASPAVERTTMDIERETESAIESLNVTDVSQDNGKSKKMVKSQVSQKSIEKGSQKSTSIDKQKDNTKVYDVVDKMPSFPGGNAALFEYLSNNIQYPKVAEENRMEGRVIVTFVVEKDGSISNAKLARSVSEELDAEAIRVVSSMPKWQPGSQNGEPVSVMFTVPVIFRLSSGVSTPYKKEHSLESNETKVIYMVDGKEASEEEVQKLSPLNIESMTVVKKALLLKQYGAKEGDKVVVIQRKKP